MQIIDSSFWMAKTAKRASKTFLKCVEKVRHNAVEYAIRHKCDVICVGHTHHPEIICLKNVQYVNCGCWTELPANYVTIKNGIIEIEDVFVER